MYCPCFRNIKRHCYINSEEIKKNCQANQPRIFGKKSSIDVEIRKIVFQDELSIEMDEMWSFCHDKQHQVWLWWAIDHNTNTPLAFVFGTHENDYLYELLELLEAYNIGKIYADGNFAYSAAIPAKILCIGKKNTQNIERNHLTLRTRIKRLTRRTICFSKNIEIHKAVIGTFINLFYFKRKIDLSTIVVPIKYL